MGSSNEQIARVEKMPLKDALRQIETFLLIMKRAEDTRKVIEEENNKILEKEGIADGKKIPDNVRAKLRPVPTGSVRKQSFWLKSLPGVGKEQPLCAKILTPNGWMTMGDMKVGSKVITPSNEVATVTEIFPQGIKDVYAITFSNGEVVECGLEHLWKVRDTYISRHQKQEAKRCKKEKEVNDYKIITLREILEQGIMTKEKRMRFAIDLPCITYNFGKKLEIDPYILGCLIGDGGLSREYGYVISSPDKEIIDKFREKYELHYKSGVDYSIVECKELNESLKKYGLKGCHSHEKFIPDDYMFGTLAERIALLNGLMDTDGYCNTNGNVTYTTTSEKLALQVRELVNSLGGYTTTSKKQGKYKKNGKIIDCKLAYNVEVKLQAFNPFTLSKKAEKWKPCQKQSRYIQKIEKVRQEECKCIMLDHKDHLYITDNYVITHNTARIQELADYGNKYGLRVINCGRLMEGDLGGLPVSYQKDGETHVDKLRFEYLLPDPESEEGKKIGILFFDELGNADPSVRKEFLEICDGTSRKGKKLVPERWIVVGAGNTDDTIGEEFVDFAFQQKARFRMIEVTADIDDFMNFMDEYVDPFGMRGFAPIIKAYLKDTPKSLAPTPDLEKDQNIANPRNWENMNTMVRQYYYMIENGMSEKDAKNDLQSSAKQLLGFDIGNDFIKFFELEKDMIPSEDLMLKNVLKDKEFAERLKSIKKMSVKLLSFYKAIDSYANNFDERRLEGAETVKGTKKGKKGDETKNVSIAEIKKKAVKNLIEAIGVAYDNREEYILPILQSLVKVAGDVTCQIPDDELSSTVRKCVMRVADLDRK